MSKYQDGHQEEQFESAESVLHYSMVIEWSNRDNQYVVTLPEWEAAGWSGHTGAKTYEAAAKRGRNMIENYIMWSAQDGKPLPKAAVFDTHFYADDEDGMSMADAEKALNTSP